MKRTSLIQSTCSCLLAMLMCSVSAADSHVTKVVTSFLKHVESMDSLDTEKKSSIKASVEKKRSSDGITDGLIAIYPKYSAAVESSDAENTDQAIELLSPLAESEDKFLAADANFYLARTLMNSERFEEAMPRLEKLIGEMGDHSAHQGSAQYFKAVAQAGLLKNKEAVESFKEFIANNPDAPERLLVSAWRQHEQLKSIKEGQLDDVHQRMDYSRRRLTQIETGEKTQQEQDKIVGMLTEMIKEAEKKECST